MRYRVQIKVTKSTHYTGVTNIPTSCSIATEFDYPFDVALSDFLSIFSCMDNIYVQIPCSHIKLLYHLTL